MEQIQRDETQAIRAENIIWTMNRDYQIAIRPQLLEETEIKELTLLRSVLLGGLFEHPDAAKLESYFVARLRAMQNVGILREILFLSMEEAFLARSKSQFVGIFDIEKDAVRAVCDHYAFRRKRGDVYHELRYAYYTLKAGKVPKTNPRVYDLVMDLKHFAQEELNGSAGAYIAELNRILQVHLHIEPDDGKVSADRSKDETPDKTAQHEPGQAEANAHDHAYDDQELEQVTAAEFSQYDIGREEEEQAAQDQAEAPREFTVRSSDRTYEQIVARYGKPWIRGKALEQLEFDLAQGVHSNARLHLCKDFMQVEGFQRYKLEHAYETSYGEYRYGERIYRRNALRLRDQLVGSITQDMDYAQTRLDNGILDASRLWRKHVLGEPNVFYKNFRSERGSFVVELLLDASGSQRTRQHMVAIQAYIIAQALSMAHIPCRVTSFHNLFDYTILKQYRDFYDPQTQNMRIFSYRAEGSNRDGLAIATVGKQLLERPEEHRVLIVLSDGKPNDERLTGTGNLGSANTLAYTGQAAIEDTARRVRALRRKEVAVLGVFTGEYEDLAAEQTIFGRDFAYISKMERFSEIVGIYLKKQITNMLEQE